MAQDNVDELTLETDLTADLYSGDSFEQPIEETNESSVDPLLMDALFNAESAYGTDSYNPNAVSSKGAQGTGQIMPDTWEEYADPGMDPFNEGDNKEVSQRILEDYTEQFGGDEELGLAAYNMGPTALRSYLEQTESGTWEEVKDLLESRGAYTETTQYVTKVTDKYKELKGNAENTNQREVKAGLANSQTSSNTASKLEFSSFNEAAAYQLTRPEFDSQSTSDRLKNLSDLYYSKNWEEGADSSLREVSSFIWKHAKPEEDREFQNIVGAPPLVPSDQDPAKVLQQWKEDKVDEIYEKGLNPDFLGDQFYEYLDSASNSEIEAFNIRNQGTASFLTNRAGNMLRQTGKGLLDTPAMVVAGATRVAGSLIDPEEAGKTADYIQSLPDVLLGEPSNDFTFATDPETGRYITDESGEPVRRWQWDAYRSLVSVGASIGTAGVAALARVPQVAVLAGQFAGYSAALANDTFRQVYELTGDVEKAYAATAFTLPAAAVGTFANYGIVGKLYGPSVAGLRWDQQARFLARTFTEQATLGSVGSLGAVGIQQAGEEIVSGEGYDPGELKTAALVGAFAGGLAGTALGYVGGVRPVKQAYKRVQRVEPELQSFQNDIRPEVVSTVKPGDVVEPIANKYGVSVGEAPDGNAIFTKKSNVLWSGNEDVGTLLQYLGSQDTPGELAVNGKRLQELTQQAEKTPQEQTEFEALTNRLSEAYYPEHNNNIKATEFEINKRLQDDPSQLPVRWLPEDLVWEHVETGKRSTFLKEALGMDSEAARFDTDLSDVSSVKVFDESTPIEVTPIKSRSQERLVEQIQKVDNELDAIKVYRTEEPTKATREESAAKQAEAEQLKAAILRKKNDIAQSGNKEEIAAFKSELNDFEIQERELKAQLEERKQTIRGEKTVEKDFRESEKTVLAREKLENRRKDLEGRLKLISNRDRDKSVQAEVGKRAKLKDSPFGAIRHGEKGKDIFLSKNLPPEAKSQVLAHEYAHAITDNLKFSDDVNAAIDDVIGTLKKVSKTTNASEIADEVFLPSVKNALKIPENIKASELDGKSKKALFGRREFLANQIAAIMAKRSGRDIGKVKIVAELEAALERTKLPKYPVEKKTDPSTQVDETVKSVLEEPDTAPVPVIERERVVISEEAPPKGPEIGRTGERKETAFSKYAREFLPDLDPVFYDAASREATQANAAKWVNDKGVEAGFKLLETENRGSVGARFALADALVRKTGDNYTADPTPGNERNFVKAEQLRATVPTEHAQALALLQRIRGVDSFTDFMTLVTKSYREAGLEFKGFTEYMVSELKEAYTKTRKLPGGVIRDDATMRLFQQATRFQDTPWNELVSKYFRYNLLSGFGTPVINFAGGAWMAAATTALRHPMAGKGLVWRTMFSKNALATGLAEATRAIKGKPGSELLGGLLDHIPVDVGISKDAGAVKKYTSLFLNKFGNVMLRPLYASDAFFRRLAYEGYSSVEYFKKLNEQHPNNPSLVSAKVAEYVFPNKLRDAAMSQARSEIKRAGVEPKWSDVATRAYEILRRDQLPADLIDESKAWADSVSLRGDVSHVAPWIFDAAANKLGERSPVIKTILLPFSRAMARLSDFGLDFIPGMELFDPKLRQRIRGKAEYSDLTASEKALRQRAVAGRNAGLVLASTFLAGALEGVIEITGEEEDVLGPGGEDPEGPAQGRQEFREFAQRGKEAFTVYINGSDYGFKYKDFPGLNAILLGVHQFKKSLDKGQSVGAATFQFYSAAFKQALPFFGEQTLSGPYQQIARKLFEAEGIDEKSLQAFKEFSNTFSRMAIPASSLLSDVKKIYDTTPEETVQDHWTQLLRNVPGVSEAIGSKPLIDRFGNPEERSGLEHFPGLPRIFAERKAKDDEVWQALGKRDLIIPELPKRYEFRKKDFSTDNQREQYTASREERFSKAYTNTFTPDEWYNFILATGPQIRRVAGELVRSSAPDSEIQEQIIKRVRKIEEQSRKRYIRTGKF